MKKGNYLNFISKSALAGILIALAGAIYLNSPNKIIGALLFSVGLISVLEFKAKLYTGMVGNIDSKDTFIECLLALIINIAAAALFGVMYRVCFGQVEIFAAILNQSVHKVLLEALCCGSLIYIACDIYKTTKNILIVLLCIMGFILSNSLHSIACSFYIALGNFSWKAIGYLGLIIIGNAIGALLVRFLYKGLKINC